MKRVAKFQEGGDVEMTAAERRRQNIQRLNERRAANRAAAETRAEIERFNERMRQGTLTPEDMRRMGGRSDIERFSERAQRGTLTADDMRRMGGTPTQQAAPAPSMRDAVRPVAPGTPPRSAADMMRGAMQSPMARAMGTGRAAAGRAAAEGAMRVVDRLMRGGRSPATRMPSPDLGEGPAEPMRTMTPGYEEDMYAGSVAGRPAPRSQPARRPAPRRNVDPEGTQAAADAERERQRIAAIRGILEGGDIQPREPNLDERIGAFMDRNLGQIGLRRTNETGEGAPSTGSLRGDLQALGRALGFKKGGMVKPKKYQEGGPVKVPGKKPAMGGPKAPATRMRDMISPEERRELDAPLTRQELDRMRESGFKKGGAVKPKTAMKKGGPVKKAAPKMMKKGGAVAPKAMKAGGKVAPKKMMKGGVVAKPKPKKMMGGGRAMYAKGGMARGCK